MKLEYIRASQIGCYLECSAKFLFQNILEVKTLSKPALAFGSAIHQTLEKNFSQKINTRVDLPLEESLDTFSSNLDSEIRWVDKADLVKYDTASHLKDSGVELLKLYYKDFSYRIFPKQVETTVKVKFEGFPYGLSGTIDLLDEDNVLIDHKTSAKVPTEVPQNYRLQLGGAYALLMEAKLSEPVRYSRIDYLIRKGLQPSRIIPVEILTDTKYFMVIFEKVSEGIERQIFLPNRNHYLCSQKWCKYWEQCEKSFGGCVKK